MTVAPLTPPPPWRWPGGPDLENQPPHFHSATIPSYAIARTQMIQTFREVPRHQKIPTQIPDGPRGSCETGASHFCTWRLGFPTGKIIGSHETISKAPAGSNILLSSTTAVIYEYFLNAIHTDSPGTCRVCFLVSESSFIYVKFSPIKFSQKPGQSDRWGMVRSASTGPRTQHRAGTWLQASTAQVSMCAVPTTHRLKHQSWDTCPLSPMTVTSAEERPKEYL